MAFRKMRRPLLAGTPGVALLHRDERTFAAILMPLAIAALSAGLATPASAGSNAADPRASVPKARYRPVIEGYTPYRPVEPRAWQGLNRDVAPKPKPPAEDKR